MANQTYSYLANQYNRYANDYDTLSNTYNAFNKSFGYGGNPFLKQFSSAGYDTSGLVSAFDSALSREKERANGRSLLDRVFDTLLAGNYASAGFAKGLVDNGSKDDISPLEGLLRGLKAANPFGDGYNEGEYTYSKVLGEIGWNPSSTSGKIAKGTLGFIGDVLLDPTTYLTGGASAILKGTGQIGKAGSTIEKLGVDSARAIAETKNAERGVFRTAEELDSDAVKLSREYNRLMGVDRQGAGLNLSLGNLPFGNKVFGENLASKKLTLFDDAKARAIGDATLAPLYREARDKFYRSTLGQMFSTNTAMYRIASEDPGQLYDFLRSVDVIKGQAKDKLQAEKLIRSKMQLFNLSPAENKEVLSLLQDKSIWNKIKSMTKFSDSMEGKAAREEIQATRDAKKAEYDDLVNKYVSLEDEIAKTGSESGTRNAELASLRDEYKKKLIDFDVYATGQRSAIENHNHFLRTELSSIEKGTDNHFSDAFKSSLNEEASVTNLVDNLNSSIFGSEKMIGYSAPRQLVKEVIDMIQGGKSRDAVRDFILRNEEDFSGVSKAKYKYVANELGYKDWKTAYHDKKAEILQRTLDGTSTEADGALLKSLDDLSFKRAKMLKDFKNAHTHEQVMQVITRLENQKLAKEIDEIDHLTNTTGSRANTKRETHREKLMDDSMAAESKTYTDSGEYVDTTSVNDKGEQFKDVKFVDHKPSSVEKLDDVKLDHKNEGLARYDIKDFMRWNVEGKELNEQQQAIVNKILSHYEELINKSYHINYEDLSYSSRKQLFKEARQKVVSEDYSMFKLNNEKNIDAVVDEVKKRQEKMTKEQFRRKLLADQERIKAEKTLRQDYTKRKEEVIRKLEENNETLQGLKDTRESLIDEYKGRMAQAEKDIDTLTQAGNSLKQALKQESYESIETLKRDIQHLDEALASDEAFDTYTQTVMNTGHAPQEVVSIALDNLPYSDKVKEITRVLRQEFMDIAHKEIEIGKLKPEQIDDFLESYVPNILTPAGQVAFGKNRTIQGGKSAITQDMGFGMKFNPFSKSRKITEIELDGKVIKNPTIEQKNEFFKEKVGGDAYSTNLADLYLTRAMKHTELVYDDLYMQTMLHEFGDHVNQAIKPNHTIVSNYGVVRKNLQELSGMQMSMYISADLKEQIQGWTSLYGKLSPSRLKQMVEEYFKKRWTPENLNYQYSKFLDSTIADAGFTKKQLEDLATPMVELSEEHMNKFVNHYNDVVETFKEQLDQRQKNSLLFGTGEQIDRVMASVAKFEKTTPLQIRQVNNAIVQKANQARKLQIAKDQNDMLKLYDKFTHLMKLNQTTVMPAFHIRNKMANTFLNWLGVGRDAFSPTLQVQAWKAARNKGAIPATEVLFTKNGGYQWSEVYEQAKIHGVIDEGFFAKDIGAGASTKGMLGFKPKTLPFKNAEGRQRTLSYNPKFDPTDSENFFLYRKGGEIGNQIENSDRLLHFASLLKRGMSFEQAAYQAKQFLFDYSDLTSFEQQVMKRIFPFYTWLRKNSALQVEQLIEQPEKYRLVAKELNGLEGGNSEDERVNPNDLAPFAQDWVQLPFSANGQFGNKEPILFNPNLPFNDLSRIPNPLDPVNSIKQLFTQSNPMIKVPIEELTNRNVFLDKPIVERGDIEIVERLKHIASQFSILSTAGDLGTSDGADFAAKLLNATTGIKTTSYDVEGFKRLQEQQAHQESYNPILEAINRRLGN